MAKRASEGKGAVELDTREREILQLLWRVGRLSRWELHRQTGVNPNAVGVDVGGLLKRGIIRECPSAVAGPGRPRIPLEIDPVARHVIGIAVSPGCVEAARLTLRGQLLDPPLSRNTTDPAKTVAAARALLRESLSEQTLGIGLSVTGFVDLSQRAIVRSSSFAGQAGASLASLYETAGDIPLVLANNMHALGAWWLLIHQSESDEDVLLTSIADGQTGAALLIDGRPNRGCATGGNELGHMRYPVDTEMCYCGHPGCLERIYSTEFLRRRGVMSGTLIEHIARFGSEPGADPAADKVLREILEYLSMGLSNVINFIRPHRLVLTSELTRFPVFTDALINGIRSKMLPELTKCVRIDPWDQADSHSAETAGWLALASLYREGWHGPAVREPVA